MLWCPACGKHSRIVASNSMADYCENWHASNGYRVHPITLEPFDEEE